MKPVLRFLKGVDNAVYMPRNRSVRTTNTGKHQSYILDDYIRMLRWQFLLEKNGTQVLLLRQVHAK